MTHITESAETGLQRILKNESLECNGFAQMPFERDLIPGADLNNCEREVEGSLGSRIKTNNVRGDRAPGPEDPFHIDQGFSCCWEHKKIVGK